MVKLSIIQAANFATGYNAKVESWNAGKSDCGKTPYRAGSFAAIGYDVARSEVVKRQVAGEVNIQLTRIDTSLAQGVYNSALCDK